MESINYSGGAPSKRCPTLFKKKKKAGREVWVFQVYLALFVLHIYHWNTKFYFVI